MTQEEKQLILKDLCARLPYGVKVHITHDWFYEEIEPYDRRLDCDVIKHLRANEYTVKPYLRPMSSMTEEEYQEFGYDVLRYTPREFDWLNAHHFDYRGLIEKGLALEAPEGMYKTE